jgi:nucleoside-diphosphate-sugar epimerase
MFEAVKRRGPGMAPLVYTSSIAAFADDDADPATGRLTVEATGHPRTHYGVYKVANEGNARVYWLDDGVPSIGLRPMTVYGVGRDQGMTSGPTKAVVAAVLGLPYTVAFGGPTLFQYAEDVAGPWSRRAAVASAAHVFNLPGEVADGPALVGVIEAAVPARRDGSRSSRSACPSRPRSTTTASRPRAAAGHAVRRASTSVAIYQALAARGRSIRRSMARRRLAGRV